MTVLALECSTARGSVALAGRDGRVLWRTEFTAGRGHGGKLFLALAEALRLLGEAGDEKLGEIVVGLGPGSYSGVRQAIAAATGLSAATGAHLAGVPSPLALETSAPAYQAVGDARRGTFYYTAVERGVCIVGPELLESRAALLERLAERPGWPVLAVECDHDFGVDAQAALPLAERLRVVPASERRGLPLEPLYLRPTTITLPVGMALRGGP
jgi:tRNA threonylcarbamoyladenosine biosynthesis protein TsaB